MKEHRWSGTSLSRQADARRRASRSPQRVPRPAVLATEARAAADSPLGGAEVKALFVGDPFAQASQRIIADLNQLAGGTISMQVVDFDSMHQKILLDAPSAAPAFDVYSWEFSWLGEMVGANALRPLDDFVERDAAMLQIDDIPKANWDATVWDGKRYGIPVQPHAELTWWRTDLLEAAGLQPPKTTDELLAAAQALHKPDEGVYGFLWKGARGAPLGQTMVHAFAAFDQPAFPNWQNGDWTPALNTDKAVQATEWVRQMAQYAPPDYLNIAWDDEARRFAQGEAAMTFTWFGRESFFSRSDQVQDRRQVCRGSLAGGAGPVAEELVRRLGARPAGPDLAGARRDRLALRALVHQRAGRAAPDRERQHRLPSDLSHQRP